MRRVPRVLIVKNVRREGPGAIAGILRKEGIRVRVSDHSDGKGFPDPAAYDGVIVLGGPDSANDASGKMKRELAQIKKALGGEIPYIGICLGMQALAKAAGGRVVKSPIREIGWREPDSGSPFEVTLTPKGRKDPLFEGLPGKFRVFQLHGETIRSARGTEVIGVGRFCRHQMIKAGRCAYGFQAHLELTGPLLRRWLREDDDLKRMNPRPILTEWGRLRQNYQKTGVQIFKNYARLVRAHAAQRRAS